MLRLSFRFGTFAVLTALLAIPGVSARNTFAARSAVQGPARGTEFTARVVAITDGDTIRVTRDDRSIPVRLNGIDCPEKGQPFGTRAKQFTADLAFGKTVTVQVRDTDRYGRTVADAPGWFRSRSRRCCWRWRSREFQHGTWAAIATTLA